MKIIKTLFKEDDLWLECTKNTDLYTTYTTKWSKMELFDYQGKRFYTIQKWNNTISSLTLTADVFEIAEFDI